MGKREMEIELLGEQHFEGMDALDVDRARVLLAQIGTPNVLAISGGRVKLDRGAVLLPVGSGYTVMVQLSWNDTYTVRRIYRRGAKTWVKGTVSGVYFDEIGELAYVASCYVNRDFGGHLVR